jgi:hypothetical protein
MKTLLLCALCALFLFGCSNGASKFVGKWKSTDDRIFPEKDFLLISKKGDQYVMSKSSDMQDTVVLAYNEEVKFLSGRANGAGIELKYNKETDHIMFIVAGDTRYVEFKKAE